MNSNPKNELLQFVGGLAMLAVGLFIFSQKVVVRSGFFGGGVSLWGFRLNTGLVIVPLIIGIVWLFATNSFASKVFTGFAALFIVAVIIMNTNMHLMTMSLYDWIIILVLIFGGLGLTAKVLLASNNNGEKKGKRAKKDEQSASGSSAVNSIDEQLEQMKKNMK